MLGDIWTCYKDRWDFGSWMFKCFISDLKRQKVYCPFLPLASSWGNDHRLRMCLVPDVSQHKPLWDAARAVALDNFRRPSSPGHFWPVKASRISCPECPWQWLAVYRRNMGLNRLPEGPDWLRALQGPAAPQVPPYQCSRSPYKTSQRQPY